MKLLVTGSSGFIGFSTCLRLLQNGHDVVGIDNHNEYYDPVLKNNRTKLLQAFPAYTHIKGDICDHELISSLFKTHQFNSVIHLAAQAGVQYSIEEPMSYIESNIVGFTTLIDIASKFAIKHFVYASSSSVYGSNGKSPFSSNDHVNHPLSLYAATKKSNELIAHAYSHLFQMPTTGLRFFTVYGPWGRPDMAMFKFTKNILEEKPIVVFNNGNHQRDFTYIDDIVSGIYAITNNPPKNNPSWDNLTSTPNASAAPWRIYNIGRSKPTELLYCIQLIEKALNKKAIIEFAPLQKGDVVATHADINDLVEDHQYEACISIEEGLERFISWYLSYYDINQHFNETPHEV